MILCFDNLSEWEGIKGRQGGNNSISVGEPESLSETALPFLSAHRGTSEEKP